MMLEELEKEVRILKDIEEIKQLQYRYCNSLILANYDELLSYFTDDAEIDLHAGHVKGKAQMAKLFKEKIGLTHIGKEGNYAVHPIITVDGDKAKGSWIHYIQFAQPRKLKPKPEIFITDDAPNWLQGFYEMEYRRVNGKWLISYLKWRCRLASPMTQLVDYKP